MAHEINNPINGIINYAQLLLIEAGREGQQSEIAERIMKEGNRIASIVKSLLSFARDRKEDKRSAAPGTVLRDALSLTEAQLHKNGIFVNVDMPPDLTEIYVNVQQILQVFLNVINNARYALNERYPGADDNKVLDILGKKIVSEGVSFVRFAFTDRGTGIPSALITRIMNPFFTTKPPGVGTGLGLSISHGIITDHGGRMNIESIEGEFTRVLIDLPVSEESA